MQSTLWRKHKKEKGKYCFSSVEKCQTKTCWSSTYILDEFDFGNRTKKSSVLFTFSVESELDMPAAPGDGELQPSSGVHSTM